MENNTDINREIFSLRDIPNDLIEIIIKYLDREDKIKLLNLAKMREEKNLLIGKIREEHNIEFLIDPIIYCKSLEFFRVKECGEDKKTIYLFEDNTVMYSINRFGIYFEEKMIYPFSNDYETYFVFISDHDRFDCKKLEILNYKSDFFFIFYLNKFECITYNRPDSSAKILSSKRFDHFIRSFDLQIGELILENGDTFSLYFEIENDIIKRVDFAKLKYGNEYGKMFVDNDNKIKRIALYGVGKGLLYPIFNYNITLFRSIFEVFNSKLIDENIDYIKIFYDIRQITSYSQTNDEIGRVVEILFRNLIKK